MKNSRRDFLQKMSMATLATGLPLTSCMMTSSHQHTSTGSDIPEFGIQLWTVKEDMEKNPMETLKKISKFGYSFIETFSGKNGIYWGMPAKTFAQTLNQWELKVISSHIDPKYSLDQKMNDEFKHMCEEAAEIGMKYFVNPFPGEFKSNDEWKKLADGLNKQGEIAQTLGMKMAYHNHQFEFELTTEGNLPAQMLLDYTDPEKVFFELDIYWITKAGHSAEVWLKKNPGRYKLVHVKDLLKADVLAEIEKKEKKADPFWPVGGSTFLGNGRIDFPKILNISKQKGVEHFIVEQERFDNSTPMKDIEKNAAYFKKFKFA